MVNWSTDRLKHPAALRTQDVICQIILHTVRLLGMETIATFEFTVIVVDKFICEI